MKSILNYAAVFLLSGILFFISCKKDVSCEGCAGNNKPPIANAGNDQIITLPKDSVSLDGSASTDADGKIVSLRWTKISGPVSSNIIKADSSKILIKALVMGVYKFELAVTDNEGLSAKDTVQIIVDDPVVNQPPVANAGADQIITLPVNTIILNGSASLDPDNNIATYLWTKIIGPSSFNIANANAVQTAATNLVQGTYLFELKVKDAGGLFSRDTMQVTVNSTANTNSCGSGSRPQVNAQLIPVGNLSQTRPFISTATIGNKIFFAGGQNWASGTSRVDIYNITTNNWSTAELSVPRWQMATVTAGNKIFFAGGGYYDNSDNGFSYNTVDIYDNTTNQWTTTSLSSRRKDLAAATVGSKVFFAGGSTDDFLDSISNRIDIYDLITNTWSLAALSEPKAGLAAVTSNNKVYFAGGISGYNLLPNNSFEWVASNKIDVYDNSTNTWSTSFLDKARYYLAGINTGSNIFWAGGMITNPGNVGPQYHSCAVEIKDVNNQSISLAYLYQPMDFYICAGQNAVVKENKIVFFTGSRYLYTPGDKQKFDIYDVSTNTWAVGLLPVSIDGASIISVNNVIYVAGGIVNGVLSNQVYKLEF